MIKNEMNNLKLEIEKLEANQKNELLDLKNQMKFTLATLSPSNLIKTTIQDVIEMPDLQDSVVDNVIGLATGYISKKLLIGSTHNPVKKLLGNVFQMLVTSYTANHSEGIKKISSEIFSKLLNRKKNSL
jgi:hypothetical protein